MMTGGLPCPKITPSRLFGTSVHAALAARVVGTAAADRLALSGAMLAPQDALRVGLVDEVVPRDGLMVGAAVLCCAVLFCAALCCDMAWRMTVVP